MNVVVIMTDQQSARTLPMYGNPVVRTPNLAALAAQGRLFANAFTSCPLCVPARVSLFTGQYPSAHGSLNNTFLMAPGRNHLLRILKTAGYTCGLAGKNHCFEADDLALFDQCDRCGHNGPVTDDPYYKDVKEWIGAQEALRACWGWVKNPYPPERLGTTWTTDRAIEFIERHTARPFFLWFSIPDPHIPFQTAEPYASMYPPERVDMPVWREGEMTEKPRAQRMDQAVMAGEQVDEATVRQIRSIYYGMNTFIDDQVGRFLDRLDELNLADDTLVIYVSDHGEYLGEHRMIRKSKAAYDCLTHVPMILRGSGIAPGEAVEVFVSMEDLAPTILARLGLAVPSEMQGRDLSPVLAGAPAPDRAYAYGEYGATGEPFTEDAFDVCRSPHSPDFAASMKVGGHGKMRYIRDHRWKLVAYVGDAWELYDLQADPGELHNLHGRDETAEVTARLTAALVERMMRYANPGVPVTPLS